MPNLPDPPNDPVGTVRRATDGTAIAVRGDGATGPTWYVIGLTDFNAFTYRGDLDVWPVIHQEMAGECA